MSAMIVTPRFHASHHAVDRRYGDSNFSTIFSLWDNLFHSYQRPENDDSANRTENALGLPEARDQAFLPGAWLAEPFKSSNLILKNRNIDTSE